MLNGYRRHFVVSNMVLTGLVLLASFIVIGAMTYKYQSSELENTMKLVIKPWEHAEKSMRSDEGRPPHSATPDEPINGIEKPRKPETNRTPIKGIDRNITTVFYNKRSGSVSFLSDSSSLDTEIVSDAAAEIIKNPDSFGVLNGYGVIYYKESTESEYKIALTNISYLTSRMIKSTVMLFVVFLASMGIILIISLRLSKLAAKPMENAIEMERNFVADISHDLKTPITVILTNNSIIKSNLSAPTSDHKQWIDSTETAAKAMMKLVNEMLTLFSLESVSREVEIAHVNLSSVAEKCVLQMESVAYERNITIDSKIDDDVSVMANQEYVERICSGLVDNALKYESDGGNISVEVRNEKKNVILRVTNCSSIIDQNDLPHIFDRFYRGDKTRNMKSGHGLGLPIIKQIVEMLDAQIFVQSDPGSGTSFTVVFKTAE